MAQEVQIVIRAQNLASSEVEKVKEQLKAAGLEGKVAFEEVANSTKKATKEISEFKQYMKEARSEKKQFKFVVNETKDALAVFGLTLNMAAGSMGKNSEETKKMVDTVNKAIIGYEGFNAVLGVAGRFLPALGGPWGIAISVVGALGTAMMSLGDNSKSTSDAIQQVWETLKKRPDFDSAKELKVVETAITQMEEKKNALWKERAEISKNWGERTKEQYERETKRVAEIDKEIKATGQALDIATEYRDKLDGQVKLQEALATAQTTIKGISGDIKLGLIERLKLDQDEIEKKKAIETDEVKILQYNTQLEAIQVRLAQLGETQAERAARLREEYEKTIKIQKLSPEAINVGVSFAVPEKLPEVPKPKALSDYEEHFQKEIQAVERKSQTEYEIIKEWDQKTQLDRSLSESTREHAHKVAVDAMAKYEQEQFKKAAQTTANYMKQGIGIISQFSAQASQAEIDRLETERDQKLANINAELDAEGTSEARKKELIAQRQALEDDYNQQVREEKKRAFETDKEAKIIQATMDTALAVVEALPNFILAGIVGAMGAAQIALIASQPTPRFAQGGQFIVPPGYENDTFPMLVSSRERVTVETPEQQDRNRDRHTETSNTENSDSYTVTRQEPVTIQLSFGDDELSLMIKKSIERGLRKTGLPVEKYFVNNRATIALS